MTIKRYRKKHTGIWKQLFLASPKQREECTFISRVPTFWEFVQWVLPQRLRPPSADYKLTVWTPAGKKKLLVSEDRTAMVAGVDYMLDEKFVEKLADVFPFPKGGSLFAGSVPTSYNAFRQTWILQKRTIRKIARKILMDLKKIMKKIKLYKYFRIKCYFFITSRAYYSKHMYEFFQISC